jgi:hypothetical protein
VRYVGGILLVEWSLSIRAGRFTGARTTESVIVHKVELKVLVVFELRCTAALDEAKSQRNSYHKTLHRKTLRRYQEQIAGTGKFSPEAKSLCKTGLVQNLCLLIPERGRLALIMASDEPLSSARTWPAIHSLCTRDLSVLYLRTVRGHVPREALSAKIG